MADPSRAGTRGLTRSGGAVTLIVGLVCFVVGGTLYAFVSASGLVTRLFPLLAVLGLAVALYGVKNVFLPSARDRRSVGD